MGLFKQLKQMKGVVAEAPDLIRNAQAMQQSQAAVARAQAEAVRQESATLAAGPAGEPIAGVSLELYAEVSRKVTARGGDPAAAATIAREHGIDGAAWDTASAGWNERMRSVPAIAARFNELWRGVD